MKLLKFEGNGETFAEKSFVMSQTHDKGMSMSSLISQVSGLGFNRTPFCVLAKSMHRFIDISMKELIAFAPAKVSSRF
jgi:hypothetical protein